MKYAKALLFICFSTAVFSAAADDTIYDWTNVEGKTIRAQFVKSDGSSVTIIMSGRRFDYPLAKLNAESQALAKKLASGNSRPTGEVDPFGPGTPTPAPAPENKPKPPVAGKNPLNVGGKALLPTIGEGQWSRYYTVNKGRNFDVAVHASGRLYFFLKDSDGEVIGKPLRLSFRVGYYTKKDPSKGYPHAYYRDNPDSDYTLRKMVSFEPPSAPPSESGFRKLELVANYDDEVKLKMGFEVSSNRVAITGEPVDPRSAEYASVMAIDVYVPQSIEVPDNWRAPDWTPVVGDTTLSVVPSKGGRAVDLSYLDKWEDIKKKTGISRDIQEAELHGKLFGKRKVSLASKSFRDLRFMIMRYVGVFPFQPYHLVLEDSKTGGEIDRSRRLEIEIR